MQNLVVLGATGSIGRNTLDVAARHPDKLRVLGLSANRDVEGLHALCVAHRPEIAVLADAAAAATLRQRLRVTNLPTQVESGAAAISALAAHAQADQVMSAIVGAIGLAPTLAAVRAGKRVLIANKEPLVMAGALLMAEACAHGATILPVDSEHNAIFQCLPAASRCGEAPKGVRRLILTASGGPFRDTPLAELDAVTPQQAVRHPNWVMGPKISVDSATMMNKGLELIEAGVLYALPSARIEVVIHPQSAIHSIVEYVDGSMLAQLGVSDMRVPIAHALAWPERWESGVEGLDLARLGVCHFQAPDDARFPCLKLAREAMEAGGSAPIVLNAANEIAVEAFLSGSLGFSGIAPLIAETLHGIGGITHSPADLASILEVDARARQSASAWLARAGRRVVNA